MAGSAFFTAASGLRNHQVRLDVIANNIANINTHGYKGSALIFGDVLSQTIRGASAPSANYGGINPKQIGLGMTVAAIHNLMTQAALESTSRQTDFAVNGSGFFIATNNDQEIYTRAGDFNVDRNGRLVLNNGFRVQGYNELTADGRAISPSSRMGDILIEFGKKLEAKPTTLLGYSSNLDSASFRYGSADNENAIVGTTGILTFAGAAEPWTTVVGDPLTAISAGPETVTINGNIITYDSSAALNLQEAAQILADAINIDPTVSAQAQATVREDSGNYQVVIQAVLPGTTIDITAVTDLASSGLIVQLYQPASEPGAFLVGKNVITVTDSQSATETTTIPVGTGINRPMAGDVLDINGETVTLTVSAGITDTAAQNAVLIANAINNTTDIAVTATANPNGTLTITHNNTGQQRQPLGVPLPVYVDVDIYLDSSVDPTVAVRWGLSSFNGWDGLNNIAAIDNGVNAMAELVFTPDDGSFELVRFVEDWAYDRSVPALVLGGGFVYASSLLTNVQGAIEGAGATFQLMPGVNISIDELAAGQATFRTEDAFVHSTSRLVYDSLGFPHNLVTTFTHVNENEWEYVVSLPEEPNILLTNTIGRITFGQQGLISSGNPLLPLQFTPPGADMLAVTLSFNGQGDPIDGITQFASATTTSARDQDGYPMGVLNDFETDNSGTIVGSYSNGQRRPIGQLALATFANPEGLERVGDTAFASTTNSGEAVMLRPGTGGAGVVFSGFLEQSNVDLALEFTNMIMTQRGLQANSRVFTTQDEILNEIVNLKR